MNEAVKTTSPGEAIETGPAEGKEDRLIVYLKGLVKRQDRAALANLRRGLGRPPMSAMEMYPYLGQFLSHETKPRYENAVFIIAALFAYYHDAPGVNGNLGASLRQLKDQSDSIEKRFVALLNGDEEDLPYYLRQTIGLLKSKDVGVNWERLLSDVQNWSSDKRFVQKNWARSFWGDFKGKDKDADTTGGTNE